jgi:hypothetical protein
VDAESADLSLELVHTTGTFGKSGIYYLFIYFEIICAKFHYKELQISLYMKNANSYEAVANKAIHPHLLTGIKKKKKRKEKSH